MIHFFQSDNIELLVSRSPASKDFHVIFLSDIMESMV